MINLINLSFNAKDIKLWRSVTTGFKGFTSEGKDFIPNQEGYSKLNNIVNSYGDFFKADNLETVLSMLPTDTVAQIKGKEIMLVVPVTEDVDMIYTFHFEFADDFSCILM